MYQKVPLRACLDGKLSSAGNKCSRRSKARQKSDAVSQPEDSSASYQTPSKNDEEGKQNALYKFEVNLLLSH